jgi:hypothetical protein
MTTVLTIILVVLMGLTVFSLVRGVIAFLKTTKIDLNSPRGGETASEMQLMQNRMMMNRIRRSPSRWWRSCW